jgi:hypothetical protein
LMLVVVFMMMAELCSLSCSKKSNNSNI